MSAVSIIEAKQLPGNQGKGGLANLACGALGNLACKCFPAAMRFYAFRLWLAFVWPPVIVALRPRSNPLSFWMRGAFIPALGAGERGSPTGFLVVWVDRNIWTRNF